MASSAQRAAYEVPIPEDRLDGVDPLDLMGHSLWRSVQRTVSERAPIEQRWLEDLQQYLGLYDERQRALFVETPDRASVFLNLTRAAVNQAESQLADLLFPTDTKNWGISPTPRPEIVQDVTDTSPVTLDDGATVVDPETGQPVTRGDVAARALAIADERCRRMERTIEDQLVECDYSAEARAALHSAAVFGSGVLAGPEVKTAVRHQWTPAGDGGPTTHVAEVSESRVPYARHVPLWDFFPDMSASTLDECEYIFERFYMTRKQVRQLARRQNYMPGQLRKVLETEPRATRNVSAQVNTLKQLTNTAAPGSTVEDNRYEFWMYHGPISKDVLIAAGLPLDPDDPMSEFDGIVVFCGATIVKAVLNPMDTEAWPYSVFCWQRDDFSVFGFGVPYMGRNEQRIANTAWRMMLDNSSKTAGPQVVMKRAAVKPADGKHVIAPWKVWYADETVSDVRAAFGTFSWPSLQAEIGNILQLAQQFMNTTVGLPPQVGQGQGQTPHTLGGMAMLMNASNTDRRRQVREWDDKVTKPLIERFYHWNMQYHPDPEIKGDYEVYARGTSALLLREQQAINLMALLDKYAAHPVLADKVKGTEALRKIVEAMHISPDEVVATDDEIKAAEQARAGQEAPPDPQVVVEQMRSEQIQLRSDMQRQLEEVKAQYEAQEAEANRELRRWLAMLNAQQQDRALQVEALRLAQSKDIDYKRILADLKKHRWRLQLDASKFKTETALKQQDGLDANYGLE